MSAPQPKTISDSIVDELNALRALGRVLEFDLSTAGLKRRIERLEHAEPVPAALYMAALYCMLGNHAEMRRCGNMVATANDEARLFHARTLANAGFFSESAKLAAGVDLSDDALFPQKLACLLGLCLLDSTLAYYALIERAKLPAGDMMNAAVTKETQKILRDANISEATVRAMLDIAGQVLRDNKLICHDEPVYYAYPADRTVSVFLPLDLPAKVVAELDWQFNETLFDQMPDAPVTCVHVGFCKALGKQA